ncbi:MAG TPA: DUF2141 domain-containing protein [Phenylobacterium sp.]|jgi:uncharacterized protein (DUF2141 family)
MVKLMATLLVGASLLGGAALAQPPGSEIVVQVQGLRSGNGQVGCALFAGPEGFPGDRSKAAQRVVGPISGAAGTCRFPSVAPGVYAITVLHDENGNGKMDKNLLGLPSEGYGASNDPQSKYGPPKYPDAKFTHAAAPQTLTVHVRYLP